MTAANQVRDAGAHASFESATWSDLETPAGATKLVNAVNDDAQRGEVVLVTIKVIDTTVRATPADLATAAFALGDFNPELCSAFTVYYGLPNDRTFGAYLCSLGLRRVDGAAKPAWSAFLAATA